MITKTKSYWLEENQKSAYPPLEGEQVFDVAVIGAGITGLTAAYLLKTSGMRVALIEKHEVACAESGHTTAHLTSIIDTRYHQLAKDFGWDHVRLVHQSSVTAIKKIAELCRRLNVDCDFKKVPAFLYAAKPGHVADLKKELSALETLGAQARWTDSVPLPFKTFGGIRIEDQATFHPTKYFDALAKAIHGDGSVIFEKTQVLQLKEEAELCQVITGGGKVTAKKVVMACHTPSFNLVVLHTKIAAYRTYAVATKVERPPELDAMYWDSEDPYHYIRNHGAYWIIGGEDHKTGMKKDTDECFANLKQYASKNFGAKNFEYAWSGQILEPVDGLPYIGKNPGSNNVFVATGYSGNGMTFGTIAGMLISDLIQEKKDRYTDIYAPSRIKPQASAKEYLLENKDFPICFLKDFILPAEGNSISDVQAGEGKIIKHNGSKIAVFKDDSGRVHAVTSICPHMGCHVHFNSSETSWDCPCHGSRFSVDGELLNGPARTGLEKVEL